MYSPKCIRNVSGCRFASRWYFWQSRRYSPLKSTKNGKGGNIFGQTRTEGREIEENHELYAFCVWGYAKGLKRKLPNSIPKLCVGARVTPPEPNAGA